MDYRIDTILEQEEKWSQSTRLESVASGLYPIALPTNLSSQIHHLSLVWPEGCDKSQQCCRVKDKENESCTCAQA